MTKHEDAEYKAIGAFREYLADGGSDEGAVRWAIRVYLNAMREVGPGEIRVRMCVAVAKAAGDDIYDTSGWDGATDEAMREDIDLADSDAEPQYRWVEATVPSWQPLIELVVEGEVEP